MTSPRVRPATRPPARPTGLRAMVAAATTSVLGLLVLGVVLASPAAAEVPAQGWPPNEPVGLLYPLLLIGGVTVVVLLAITVIVLGPAIARGERIGPGSPEVADQWLGGPRTSVGELAGPDGDDSQAGGAGARW